MPDGKGKSTKKFFFGWINWINDPWFYFVFITSNARYHKNLWKIYHQPNIVTKYHDSICII